MKLLREPEAAALAYGLTRQNNRVSKASEGQESQVVLVFDLGGGTFDVSVLEVAGGFIEVIATSGDAGLGGDDFDTLVVQWLIDQFVSNITAATDLPNIKLDSINKVKSQISSAIRTDAVALSKLYEMAEQAKMTLSTQSNTRIFIPNLYRNLSLSCDLSKVKFESLTKSLLIRILRPLREVALMAGINLPGNFFKF